MPRALSTAVAAAVAAKNVTIALFASLAFADATVYAFTGIGSITPAGPASNPASTFPYGQTFTGLGWLAKISSIPQTTKVQAQNVVLSLSGIPAALISEVTQQTYNRGAAQVWLGFFDSNGNLLADPVALFSGAMDVPTLDDEGATCTINISCENSLVSLNLAPQKLFDDADQQILYPGDLGFSFVDKLSNIQLFWPMPGATTSPYPLYMTVTPSAPDVGVGGTLTIEVTIHYSDGSTKTRPSNAGTGPSFLLSWASTNPKIGAIQYTATNNFIGVSPGTCSVIARVPYTSGSSGFNQVLKAACSVNVHS